MIFNFQALGLLIIFIIICIYYSKDMKVTKEGSLYRGIMSSTYIMQLLYIVVFVAIKKNSLVVLLSKLYLVSICVVFSFLVAYFWLVALKDKYSSKQSMYFNNFKRIKEGLVIGNVLIALVVCLLSVNVDGNIINGTAVMFVYLLQVVYVIMSLIVMIVYKKYLNKTKLYNLGVVWIMYVFLIVFAYLFREVPSINSGVVIIVLFMYLTLENSWIKEVERLQLERDHALKNNIEKSAFLTNMSHEIRTPLNTIDGFSQVIVDSDDIESIKEDAQDIRVASKNLVDIINGIIDISVIESGKLEILKENYNVYDMLDNVINITNSRIKSDDVKFITSIDKGIPNVLYGDSLRIEQVLLNILTNAIKYTKKGSIKLNVDVVKSVSMCRLKITIADTGIGIKEEDLKKIFEGLGDRDGQERDGYSLGLVVAKQLLELMDGVIDVESTYGKGSKFIVTLDQRIATDDTNVKVIKKTVVKPFDSKGKKVLIVDDNKLNIKVATKMLEPYNINIKEASSGQECLDILDKDTDFDLILMDDLMPKMSGTETLEILKKIERVEGFDIPVVVLTANAISGMRNKYLDAGFDDYLAKPIDKCELNRILKKFFIDKKD